MKRRMLAYALVTFLLGGCSGQPENEIQGYIEGDFVRVSLPESGIVETVLVKRGEHVNKERVLFTLDSERARAALEKAQSELAVAKAESADLKDMGRSAEISALEFEIHALQANLDYTMTAHKRHSRLSKTGATPIEDADRLKSEELGTRAKIRAAESRLQLARQSTGREGEIEAAQERVKAREAAVREAEAHLALRQAVAPAGAVVNDILYRPGETVANGQAVVELLPPGNIKARFYLSSEQVGWAITNPTVTLQCKGCGSGLLASVSFISSEASFRTPILYSRDQS